MIEILYFSVVSENSSQERTERIQTCKNPVYIFTPRDFLQSLFASALLIFTFL